MRSQHRAQDSIYILEHGDEDKPRKNGKGFFNPGKDYAKRMFEAVGGDREHARTIRLPKPFKDMGEMDQAGQLLDFLTSKPICLEPRVIF